MSTDKVELQWQLEGGRRPGGICRLPGGQCRDSGNSPAARPAGDGAGTGVGVGGLATGTVVGADDNEPRWRRRANGRGQSGRGPLALLSAEGYRGTGRRRRARLWGAWS